MFDIGWTELLVITCVAIIVVGPKDLPRMLRTLGQTLGKVRKMSREFQSTFNDAIREAEQQVDIADMKKQVESAGNFNPLGDLKKSIEEGVADKPKSEPAKAGAGTKPASTNSAPAEDVSTKTPEPAASVAASVETPAAEPAREDTKA